MNARLMYVLATAIGAAALKHDSDPRTNSALRYTRRPSALAFEVLHNGSNSGFTRNSEFVIQDGDELARRWRGVQQGAPEAAMPTVDFEKSTVVFVAIGIRNTDGHLVRVDSVTTDAPNKGPAGATVHYTVTSPGARCMSMQMLTSPVEVISFEHVTGVVRFKKRGVSGPC